MLILFVERRVDINIQNAINDTAIHLAATSGRVGIFKLLLDKGMFVNLTDTYVLRYMFQLNVVIWKERKLWSK